MFRSCLAGLLTAGLCATAGAQDQPDPADPPEIAKYPRLDWDDHPMLRLGEGTYVELKTRLQVYYRKSDGAIGDPSGEDTARGRIGIQGRIAGLVDFELDGEPGDNAPWRDVYVDYRQFEAIRLRAGRFKLPFCLDMNTSATNLDFVFRSRAAELLAPGRDPGVMAHGRLLDDRIRYEIGSFVHDGRNARTGNPERVSGGRTWAGRVTAAPFRSRESLADDLQMGVAATTSDLAEGFDALRGLTVVDALFYDPIYWVRGERRRVGLELRWRPGPFSVQSEYIRVTTERRGQSVEDTDLSRLVAHGWYVSATWLATGEPKSRGADRPRRPLFRGGFGAVELAARLDRLSFASEASGEPASTSPRADVVIGNADRAATFGVNWHPWRWVKLQANIIRESIADPAQGPLPGRQAFWSRVIRLQLAI
jgi:phosphate-selective porin